MRGRSSHSGSHEAPNIGLHQTIDVVSVLVPSLLPVACLHVHGLIHADHASGFEGIVSPLRCLWTHYGNFDGFR